MGIDCNASGIALQISGTVPAFPKSKPACPEAKPDELWQSLADLHYDQELTPAEQQEWQKVFTRVADSCQAETAKGALIHDLAESPQELLELLDRLDTLPSFIQTDVNPLSIPLNQNEKYVLEKLVEAYLTAGLQGFLAQVEELNRSANLAPYPSRLQRNEIETEIFREKILAYFLEAFPAAEAELEAWQPEKKDDLHKIFTFSQLKRSAACQPEMQEWIKEGWKELKCWFGPLLYQDHKYHYYHSLKETLAAQGLDFEAPFAERDFSAPISVIDLNDLSEMTYPAHFSYLPPNRVMVTVDTGDQLQTGFYNIYDASTVKHLFRRLFAAGSQDAYLLYYYPHIEEQAGGKLQVDMDYAVKEKLPENLIGKNDFKNNLESAIADFEAAFAREDLFLEEAKSEIGDAFTPELLEQIKNEPPLGYDQVYRLMLIMQDASCDEEAPEIFSLTDQQYADYRQKIEAILKTEQGMTPLTFLARAIAACDGRPSLASVLSFNLLFRKGATVHNSLFLRYPLAFKNIPDTQDQAGAIYHFMGCFFSAFTLQRDLVQRYSQDDKFRNEINKRMDLIKKGIKSSQGENGGKVNEYLLLLSLQLQLLGKKNSGQKEIMTLSGIFYEEVVEDRETSAPEIEHDFRGMAAGYALHEVLTGVNTTRQGEWLSMNDNRRNLYINVLKFYADRKKLDLMQKISLLYWLSYY